MDVLLDRTEPRRIAAAFVAARQSAQGLSEYPGLIPETLEAAYLVQDEAISMIADSIGGWKVGRIFSPLSEHYGSDRLAGPIFANSIVKQDSRKPVSMPVFRTGFAAAEAELLMRIGAAPDSAKLTYSLGEAAALIDAVHVGIEIASSPLATINDLGPTVTISDFGNNNGLVIGAEIPSASVQESFDWPISLLVDGAVVGTGFGSGSPEGPFGAVRFLLEMMAARGHALSAGQWISTGAITGVHKVAPGAVIEARFGDDHALCCAIVAAGE